MNNADVDNDSADNPDDERDPIDEVMDLLVFAPIGLALELRNLLPGLAERGRRQVKFARSVGQMATNSAKSASQPPPPKKAQAKKAEAKKKPAAKKAAAKQSKEPAKAETKKAEAKKKPVAKKAAAKNKPASKKTAAKKKPAAKKTAAKKKPEAKKSIVRPLQEIIENYDSMSARDIIGSLTNLTGADLEVIRTYEKANRGRVTVLNRVTQMIEA